MTRQTVRIAQTLTVREIMRITDTAEKLGGITLQIDDFTLPASDFIGFLSLRLQPGDILEISDNGNGAAQKFAAVFNENIERKDGSQCLR